MADKKISQLTAATLPLAGTEVLPIVQSGTTDNITVNNLAVGNLKSNATTGVLQVTGPAAGATRVMTTPDANFTVARTDVGQTFNGNQTINSGAQFPLQLTSPSGARCIQTFSDGTYTARVGVYPPEASIYVGAQSNHPVSVIVNGTVRSTFDTSGNQSIANGNLVIGTSGKGIDFSATSEGTGTMTSELLADYEEGTWTIGMSASTSGTITVNNSYKTGKYVKIGRQVTVTGFVVVSSVSSPLGSLYLTGLPYTNGSADSNNSSGSVWALGLDGTATTAIQPRVNANNTQIEVSGYSGGGAYGLASKVTGSTQMAFSATYFTS